MENEFKKIINQVTTPANEYQLKKKQNKFKPQFARFKLVIHFLDGNDKTFFSYDIQPSTKNGVKKFIANEGLGFSKLIILVQKYINGKYVDGFGVTQYSNQQNFRTAEIYCKLGSNLSTEIPDYNFRLCKWVLNKQPEIIEPKFQDGKLIIEPLKRIQLLRENCSNDLK